MWRWIVLLALVFVSIDNLPVRGRAVPIWDARDSFFPFFVLVADHARAGRLVSWDPWSNAGLPRFSDPEFGAFSPFQIVAGFAFGGTTTGFLVYWLTIWWLGGCGLFLFARHLDVPRWGAFVVSLGYLFSGVYTGHAEHISWLIGFSSLPFIVWRFDTALIRRRWLPAAESGALWGMSATAAYPGMTIVTGLFVGLWTIGRVLCPVDSGDGDGHGGTEWRHAVVALITVAVVGSLVLLPTYFSFFYEGVGVHSRTGPLPREVAISSNALDPAALVTLISPYFSLLKYQQSLTLWPLTDVSSCSVYVGALGLTLPILALVARPRETWRWYLTGLAGLGLMLAVGQALPLRGWLYDWLYPTRFFRHAAMFRLYFVFVLAILALLGVKDLAGSLQHGPPAGSATSRRLIPAAMIVVAVLALVAYYVALPADARSGADADRGWWHALVTWGGVGGLAAMCWLMPSLRRAVWVPVMMIVLSSADALLTARLAQNTMFSVRDDDLDWWNRQDQLHSPEIQLTGRGLVRTRWACESDPPCQEPNAWAMITKVPALDTYSPATNEFHEVIKAHPVLSQMALGSNRVWFASAVAVARPDEATFRAFVKRSEVLGTPPLLLHPRETLMVSQPRESLQDETQIAALPAAEPITIRLDRYTPDMLTFSVECPRAGWLLVTDRWARSWTAFVDGHRTTVYGGDFIFRAVRVAEGANRVSFVYHPLGFPWLLIVGWGTLASVAVVSVTATKPSALSS